MDKGTLKYGAMTKHDLREKFYKETGTRFHDNFIQYENWLETKLVEQYTKKEEKNNKKEKK